MWAALLKLVDELVKVCLFVCLLTIEANFIKLSKMTLLNS